MYYFTTKRNTDVKDTQTQKICVQNLKGIWIGNKKMGTGSTIEDRAGFDTSLEEKSEKISFKVSKVIHIHPEEREFKLFSNGKMESVCIGEKRSTNMDTETFGKVVAAATEETDVDNLPWANWQEICRPRNVPPTDAMMKLRRQIHSEAVQHVPSTTKTRIRQEREAARIHMTASRNRKNFKIATNVKYTLKIQDDYPKHLITSIFDITNHGGGSKSKCARSSAHSKKKSRHMKKQFVSKKRHNKRRT